MQLQNSDQSKESSVAYNDNFLPKKLDGQKNKIDELFAKAGLEQLSASTKNDGRQNDSASSESHFIKWPEPPPVPWFQIFDRRDFIAAENLIEIALHSGRDSAEGLKCALHNIIDRGEYRPLPNIDFETIKPRVAYLREKFPNFSLVLDDVDAAFAIAKLAGGHPILSPMLFVGSPGVGKSLFAAELATVLDTQPARLLQMSTAQSNSALSGSEAFWSNTKSGLIFDSLIFGETATPVFILEEIDKIGGDNRFDPTGSLYQIFEPSSAARFRDLSYDFLPIDASRIYFLCTANSLNLPAPILSRMAVYEIADLGREQLRTIVWSIFSDIKMELGNAFDAFDLTEEAVEALLQLSPRSVRNSIRGAIGQAAVRGQSVVSIHDFRLPNVGVRMGFI